MTIQHAPNDRRPFAAAAYLANEEPGRDEEIASLRGELKNELRVLRTAIGKINSTQETATEIAALRELIESTLPEPKEKDKVAQIVRKLGVEVPYSLKLMRLLRARINNEDLDDALSGSLAETVHVTPWPLAKNERTMVALVGPSGVGKTTTCAKLAAQAVLAGRSVKLIACDGFRVAGTKQLERYAELMGAQFDVATTIEDLAKAYAAAQTDVVIVDTAGTRGDQERAIERFVGHKSIGGRSRHVLLAVPASIRARDAAVVAGTFAAANANALCVTKLDETPAPAGLVHATAAANLPLAVMCNGPRVPEDIAAATASAVVTALTKQRNP